MKACQNCTSCVKYKLQATWYRSWGSKLSWGFHCYFNMKYKSITFFKIWMLSLFIMNINDFFYFNHWDAWQCPTTHYADNVHENLNLMQCILCERFTIYAHFAHFSCEFIVVFIKAWYKSQIEHCVDGSNINNLFSY